MPSSLFTKQFGVSLIELLSVIVFSGFVMISLFVLYSHINKQNLTIYETIKLSKSADDIVQQVRIYAGRAGFISEGTESMTREQAFNIMSHTHIQLCGEFNKNKRQLIELKLSDLVNNTGYLQRRIHTGQCLVDATNEWENISDALIQNIAFTQDTHRYVMKLELILQNTQQIKRQYLLPLYALMGIE